MKTKRKTALKKKVWGKITKQPKSKSWITAEYSTLSAKPDKTILVYPEDKKFKKTYSNYRVWKGKTDGSNKGTYKSFKTKVKALAYAKKLMK